MRELKQLKNAVSSLEQKIRELQDENIALKKAIIGACNTLTHHNSQLAQQVNLLDKTFKEPKWLTSKD